MSDDSTEYQYLVDAGLGGVSATVTSLPVGYSLGMTRSVSDVKYKLCYNAGNSQISQSLLATPAVGSTGPYSVTVSTASNLYHHLGAVVNVNATAATGAYFWGAVRGRVGLLVADNTSIPTGSPFKMGVNGTVDGMAASVVTGVQAIGINLGAAATKTVTTGAASGDCYIFLEA